MTKLASRVTTKSREVDGADLGRVLHGCMIREAEPIGYPDVEGILLHLTSKTGERFCFTVQADGCPVDFRSYF